MTVANACTSRTARSNGLPGVPRDIVGGGQVAAQLCSFKLYGKKIDQVEQGEHIAESLTFSRSPRGGTEPCRRGGHLISASLADKIESESTPIRPSIVAIQVDQAPGVARRAACATALRHAVEPATSQGGAS